MAPRFKKPGLRSILLGSFAVVLAIILGTLFFVVPARVEDFLETRLTKHGDDKALQAARDLANTSVSVLPPLLEALHGGDDDFALIAVLGADGRMQAVHPPGAEAWLLKNLRQRLEGSPGAPLDGALFDNGNRAIVRPVVLREGPGQVLVAVNFSSLDEVVTSLRQVVLLAFGIGLALFLVVAFFISRAFILVPLDAMMTMARRLAEADLTGRVDISSRDELGLLAEALNRIAQSWRDTLGRVRGVSDVVAGVIEQIHRTGTTVSSGASTVQARVEETSSSMVEMMASLRGIAENVEVLYQSAEESSSSIMEMAATNDEVAENVTAMAASVEETTSAIEEMTFSIKEVAKNIQELSSSTEETSSAISQMDAAIGQVEANAKETARLSEQVFDDAQTGVEALRKTLTGIDRIKDTSRATADVIDSLGRRISEIGNILNVIDDVAEQTNLLALNAAIIAAQAGDHGKGFAVVAEEIKDLAERTGASTKEIAELIRSIQEESRNAVVVMNQGARNVDEGVQLGREAEGALRKINDSTQKSTQMVKAIARATVEQARGSKQVTASIHRISETVQQISKASNEQAKGGEQIMKSAEKMKALTAHVQRSSQEQAHGSKQITRSIESINEMVTHLNRAQKEQTKGSEQVLKAVETIKGVSEHQTRSVKQLEEAIDNLQRQAEILRGEVRRFRV
ncbi:HAMP domain-containing protein [Myxococcus sp. CA051A]|uniref:HAMP domain-containing protein n=1 Tax=Myxococcus llanfairpwllgwyngyllgogerychwyrndrobwllllantysiliogogogochensis TaxID=2590453 RepID=A0A540WYA7_9BACT|nr:MULTISPECIES: HAMP domain-containing methyl-accepting chemotaxis protein [Myxococcus]NTX00420.1 HAMP domain-containing protein [Myxococcus sp. CA040A]NTX65218.1 HAMP domain-containing protein [Myxococcus sp. CA051A]TQF13987.1 HAMP domain-containing protein [Myxococcus llanfairpwllgwyngyllgogerychwyrndrobwllllantysiliogogogochensis]